MKRKILCLLAFVLMLFAILAIGVCAEEANESITPEDVFEFKGYSMEEASGDACFGFTLNHAAREAYEKQLGKQIQIGFVIVAYDKLNGQAPLDENGKPIELENGSVFVQSLNGYKNTSYSFKLLDFSGEIASRKYVISPYLYDGANAYYYEGGKISETVSGVSYNDIVALSNTHTHTEVTIAGKAATCTEAGLTDGKKCSVCDEITVAQQVINALGHTEETVAGKAATCTEAGLTDGKKCSVCGEITVEQQVINALGHTEETVAGKAATCTEAGLTDGKKCSVCGEITVAQQVINALGHTEKTIAGKAATCTEAGLTDGKKCSVCGEITVAQQVINALGHDIETVVSKAPTCTESGLTDGKYCAVCGEIFEAQATIAPLGHTEEILKGYASTCTENGKTDGKYCTVCGEVTVAQVSLDKLNHAIVITPSVAPTCQSEGATEKRECKNCGLVTLESQVIEKTDHTVVIDKAVEPNCSETGLTEGSHCSVCQTVIVAQTVIEATGEHVFAEFAEVTKAPTASADGSGTISCTKCSYSESITLNKLTYEKLTSDDIYSIETDEYNPAYVNRWKVVDGNKEVTNVWASGNDWFGNVGDVLVITLDQEIYLSKLSIYVGGNYTFATVRVKDATGQTVKSISVGANECAYGGTPTEKVLFSNINIKAYTIEIEINELKWDSALTFKVGEIEIYGAPIDTRIEHTHNYREFIEAGKAANCQETGYDIYKCFCGKQSEVTTPRTDHAYDTLIEVTEGNCMTTGTEVYRCFCGATKTEVTPTTGHIFEKLVGNSVEPTLESTGLASYKCLTCSLTEEKTLAMLPIEEINYLRVDKIENGKVVLKLNLYEHSPNFEVRYSTSEITSENYYNAEVIDAKIEGDGLVTITIELDASLKNCYYVAVMPYIGENRGEIATVRLGGNMEIPVDYNRIYHGEVLNSFNAMFDGDINTKLGTIFTDKNDTVIYGSLLRPIVDLEYMHYISRVQIFYSEAGKQVTVRWSDTPVDFMAEDSAWDGVKTITATSGWNEIEINAAIRYFQVVFTDGEAPCEVEAYGFQCGEGSEIATYRRSAPKLGDFLGMCGFVAGGGGNTPIDSVICTNVLREYHNFHWSYTASEYGQKASLFVNPRWMGDFDSEYRNYKAAGINVIPCVQWNITTGISYKVDENGLPIRDENGELVKTSFWERFDPNTYFVYADNMFAFSARYGRNNTAELLAIAELHCADTPSVGQGTVEWIEMGNEPDGSWNGIHNYLSAYMLAAATSAAYDGHCSTIPTPSEGGYHLGGKNADSTMKFALAGVAGVSNEYINALVYWMQANRQDGQVAFDAFNVHHYMTKEIVLPNGSEAYVGISPEEAKIDEVLSNLVAMRDKYYPEKEVWITEFGWDTNQSYSTPTSSHAYGEYTGRQVQAMWLTRSYLIFSACGIDKADMYMCEDAGIEATATGKYGTCGVIAYEMDENGNTIEVKKDSYYYLYTLKNALGAYTFDSEIEAYDENVMIYKFVSEDGGEAYAVWCKTSDGTKAYNYQLRIDSESATVIEAVYGDIDGVKTETVADEYGYVSVDVSENPIYVIVD